MARVKRRVASTERNIGKIIREQRESIPLTLKQLSQISGVSLAHLSRIEKGQRDELLQWKSKLENSIQVSGQANIDIEGIKQACELVSKNLTELSFENKRLALKALSIKVWIDRDDIRLEGIIPISEDAIVTTQSLHYLSLAHPPFP